MSSARTAVVTGGASGIGRAIARRLTADGLHVAVFDIAPAEEGSALTVDITDRAQVDKAMEAVRDRYGPVSVLVNAAGKDGFTRFSELSFEEWQRVVDINLNGVYHCVQSALPDMWEGRWGRIVNISSSSAHSGQPFMAHYVAAKSAVNGLTKSLALELGPRGITVNAVPPGFIDTPMLRTAEQRQRLGGTIEEHIARTPVRRVGLPEDIAATCSFLVSEEAGYITGQIIGVNGGRNT
ncbi:SDR family oxidoreductase [Streptomyces mutabilis]|uniref:SDR family oxidoreductase n=1 Tax=Streptomyces mutabilis TaxID=67332 RepID=UPI0017828C2C|nr:SDR family NAD(P)-dependent oxidoreductase [Streptomyces mutabilis]GGQ33397.1 3-oxoacyl-ACP reductase [Streptomyces mutabilis]